MGQESGHSLYASSMSRSLTRWQSRYRLWPWSCLDGEGSIFKLSHMVVDKIQLLMNYWSEIPLISLPFGSLQHIHLLHHKVQIYGGSENWCNHYRSMEVPQKTKNRVTIWSSNPTPGYISGIDENLIRKDPCTPMFMASLLTIAKTWKKPKCPLTGEWIKMWYIYTMK